LTKTRRQQTCENSAREILRAADEALCCEAGQARQRPIDSLPGRVSHREVILTAHDHKYAIADGQAVQVLIDKMLGGGTRQRRREKLLKALDEASQRYQNTSHKERQAFFHGLLTGYAVALKLL